jgi:hypothetical protein
MSIDELELLTERVEQHESTCMCGRSTEEGRRIDATAPAERLKVLGLGMPHKFVSNNLR